VRDEERNVIRLDLSLPALRRKLATWQFALIFVGVFLFVAAGVALGLFFQWRYIEGVKEQMIGLVDSRDSLESIKSEMVSYNDVASRLDSLKKEIKRSEENVRERLSAIYLLESKLGPGMRLASIEIRNSYITLECLSPSNVKVARYLDALSATMKFDSLISVPQGTREGLIDHKVTLRLR
jgi:Tfp pilus assembly protein PilN